MRGVAVRVNECFTMAITFINKYSNLFFFQSFAHLGEQVRTMVVVQAWIVLTTLEALRLAFCKYVLRQDVRIRAHQSCGAIARFILRTFFDGIEA